MPKTRLDQKSYNLVILKKIMELQSYQRAMGHIIMSKFSDTDQKKYLEIVKILQDEEKLEYDRIADEIYQDYSSLDIEDVLSDGED